MVRLSIPAMLDELASQDLVLGLFLVGVGLIFMIMGVRMFRALVAISFGVVGFVLGGSLPGTEISQIGSGLAVALVLAVCSIFFLKVAVSVLTGGWGGLAAMHVATQMGFSPEFCWIAGGIAACIGISLTFVMFQEMIAVTTSLEGALLFMGGLIVFVSQSPSLWAHFREMLTGNVIFGPFLIASGTVFGFYLQLTEVRQKESGMGVSV